MVTTREAGSRGEQLARSYLEKKGYRYIASNWSCKVGEVDLIMEYRGIRVLIEVRLRAPTQFGFGFETVARQKQKKLIRTAKYYQQKERYWGDIQFDVISIVDIPTGEPEIEHIENAFMVG